MGKPVAGVGGRSSGYARQPPAHAILLTLIDALLILIDAPQYALEGPAGSSFAYFEATRSYLEQHGKPVAFYSDKASIFRSVRDSSDFGRATTQYGRVLFELNIDIMCANTSQAKGRVERANLTLQDRLVKELRLREISTLEAANAFAPRFIVDFNARFAKPALRDFDAHRPVRADEDLDMIHHRAGLRLANRREFESQAVTEFA